MNPTAPWVIQQLREAFPYDSAPKYLIYDNDSIFSDNITEAIKSFGTRPKRTAFQSPWQNGTAERWVGLCKREVIDHVIVFNEDHLRRLLREYVTDYNAERVHTVIRDAPEAHAIEERPSPGANVARFFAGRNLITDKKFEELKKRCEHSRIDSWRKDALRSDARKATPSE